MSFCLPKTYGGFRPKRILPPLRPPGCKGVCQNSATRFSLMSKRKLNGRPPLSEGKRDFRITARFSEEEYKIVEGLEKTLGINKTEIVRSRLLSNGANIMVNAKEVIRELDR